MRAVIDGDILLYRIGFTTELETEGIAQFRMDELVHRILDTTKATEYQVYLSCGRKESFRAKLNSEYKANRTQPKPLHYQFLKNHLIDNWKAIVGVEEEADDLIGIECSNPNVVSCTIDKDILFGLQGQKYNFVKDIFHYTTEEDATLFFYKQLLMGDKADNILGIKGIGPAKAGKALDSMLYESENILFTEVQDIYREWLKEEWADQYEEWGDFQEKQMNNLILLSGIQLKIRTEVGEIWEFPYKVDEKVRPQLDNME